MIIMILNIIIFRILNIIIFRILNIIIFRFVLFVIIIANICIKFLLNEVADNIRYFCAGLVAPNA